MTRAEKKDGQKKDAQKKDAEKKDALLPETWQSRLQVIGLVGGVASGKSLVGRELERLGGVYLDVDALGHAVLEEPEVRGAIRRRWGDAVFGPGDQVSRAQLAQRVFGSSPEAAENLRDLERITHPRIGLRLQQQLVDLAGQRPGSIVVLDAPVMFKAGWDRWCDKIVLIDAAENVRKQRALARGWTEQEFQAREESQLSIEEKRNRADIVIDNSGDIRQTYDQVRNFWHTLSL